MGGAGPGGKGPRLGVRCLFPRVVSICLLTLPPFFFHSSIVYISNVE